MRSSFLARCIAPVVTGLLASSAPRRSVDPEKMNRARPIIKASGSGFFASKIFARRYGENFLVTARKP